MTMILRLTLWLIGRRIAWLSRHDRIFRYEIRDKQVVLQMALRNGTGIRWFDFDDQTFGTGTGWHPRCADVGRGHLGERVAILTFASGATAMSLLLRGARDISAFLAAMRTRDLVVDGDFTLFIWFGWLADQLGRR